MLLPITYDEIQDILSTHNLGKLDSLEQLTFGSINPTFLINNKYVLRIKDDLEKEILLFNLLPRFGIPTPSVIARDKNYLLMSYIPGQKLVASKQLDFELGSLIKKINSVTPSDLGNQEIFGNIDNWIKNIKDNFVIYWDYLKNNQTFLEDINTKIEKIFSDYCQIASWKEKAKLIHGDINPGNIVTNNGHIVGIFDFEYSTIADPLGDFERLPINFQLGDNFKREVFLHGYGQEKFSNEETTRIKMYCLSQGLWEIWATKTNAFPYGQKEIDEGTQLVNNTLMLSLSL